jgi:hypothetical protein
MIGVQAAAELAGTDLKDREKERKKKKGQVYFLLYCYRCEPYCADCKSSDIFFPVRARQVARYARDI